MTPPRLRIAQVVTRMDVGGVPDHVMTLLRGLRRDHDVTLLTGDLHPTHAATLAALGVEVVALPFSRLPDPLRDLRAAVALRALCRARRFDLLHTHMSKAALLGALVARTLGRDRPMVVNTAHNLGSLALSQPALRAIFRVYDRLLLGRATDAVIVVADRVREAVLRLGLIAPERMAAIPNGIALDRFAPTAAQSAERRAAFGAGPDSVLIVCVARLVWFKAADVLIAAFASLAASHPQARLAFVGDGPLREALAAQAAEAGLADRVFFAGERPDVPAILGAADVFALTSVSEGMPISILEAMASGLPVVATDVGGVRDLVSDGETGFLAPSRDAQAVAAALARLCADPDLRLRLGAAGRARAEAAFSGPAMVARTEAFYRDQLARRGRAPASPLAAAP